MDDIKTFKKLIRIAILVAFAFGYMKCTYTAAESLYKYGSLRVTHLESGTVISKSNEEVKIKHGHETKLYLNMIFDKSGFQSVHVTTTTYFKFQKGDRVSFYLDDEESEMIVIEKLCGVAALFCSFFILVILFFIWVFDLKFD